MFVKYLVRWQPTYKQPQCRVCARMVAAAVTPDCHTPVTVGVATGDLVANMNQTSGVLATLVEPSVPKTVLPSTAPVQGVRLARWATFLRHLMR